MNGGKQEALKAVRTATCLNSTIWRNAYILIVAKSILTHTAETRPETSTTKQVLETTEQNI